MRVADARAAAARWVAGHAAGAEDFAGAFLSGSSIWMPGEAELPAASDVDVMVVTSGGTAPPKLGKFAWDGVLIEVTYLSWADLPSAEAVLGSCHLAGSFRDGADAVVTDPTGRLARLRSEAAGEYARRRWVRRRCAHAESRIVAGLGRLDPAAPPHERLISWMFPAGVTTHVLLTAGLRNPTVRLRYAAARDLLAEYGHEEEYEELLRLLGCATMTRERVEHHLRAMTEVFDATVPLARTPFFFASDVTAAARPVAVTGCRDLIARGLHREAVFWIAATYARCLTILAADAPGTGEAFAAGFEELTGDLGVSAPAALAARSRAVLGHLPRVRACAEAILAANPGVRD